MAGWSAPHLRRCTTGKEPVFIVYEADWPRRAQKMSLPMGVDARTVQAVPCRHTDYAIPGASIFGTL